MQTELEVKFANVDINSVRKSLKKAGAHCLEPMRLMRRVLIEEPHHQAEHAFIRIRDEGNRTTLTFKRRADAAASTIDSVQELEVEVSNFDDTVAIFKHAGWNYTTYQETKRETWQLNNTEIVIDEWPWLNPYIEIEAGSEKEIKDTANALGFDWADVIYGHIDILYAQHYTFDGVRGVIDVAEVKFSDPLPSSFTKFKS